MMICAGQYDAITVTEYLGFEQILIEPFPGDAVVSPATVPAVFLRELRGLNEEVSIPRRRLAADGYLFRDAPSLSARLAYGDRAQGALRVPLLNTCF